MRGSIRYWFAFSDFFVKRFVKDYGLCLRIGHVFILLLFPWNLLKSHCLTAFDKTWLCLIDSNQDNCDFCLFCLSQSLSE